MADLDRISELLLSQEEMPDVYYSLLENARGTEPTLDPNSLEALLANRQDQAQDDFLMNMVMFLGPGKIKALKGLGSLKEGTKALPIRPVSRNKYGEVSKADIENMLHKRRLGLSHWDDIQLRWSKPPPKLEGRVDLDALEKHIARIDSPEVIEQLRWVAKQLQKVYD
tara:strand:+ start:28 stop:531 length:504 start_codon:yes stop_codon:yes gene_type:complete